MPLNQKQIYTVSQLNMETRLLLESAFKQVWITGEISNLSRPSSGHMYFSLKDQQAQIRCALFRMNQRRLEFTPENGQQVLIRAQVSIYQARGDYQLIVSSMELAGSGALQLAFEQLKNRLAKEGLFDPDHRKTIPPFPKQIGIITSPTGAAIRDILIVLKRRFASIPIVIYPSAVQGDLAASNIVSAIQTANKRNECDVLILARGGGSIEDLWPFNEETVARTIYDSEIPIVSGIGHEIDFTIADFVADQRAATPSAAAERISPNQQEWEHKLLQWGNYFYQKIDTEIKQKKMQLAHLSKRLQHPKSRLRENAQHLDQMEQYLQQIQKNILIQLQAKLNQSKQQLMHNSPLSTIPFQHTQLNTLRQQLKTTFSHYLQQQKQHLAQLSHALDAISPLQTLERGYAIVTHSKTKKVIRNIDDVAVGDRINTRLVNGELDCLVEGKTDNKNFRN